MKKIIKILVCIICFLHTNVGAQNLVPNPSFENYVECPDTSFLQFYALLDSTWMQFNSADPYNTCSLSNYYSIPENRFGSQNTHTGNGYVGFAVYYNSVFSREYIEVQLISPLIVGQTYYVQFYVSLADTMQYAIENIGAIFTDTLFDPFPAPTYNWQTGIP